MVQLSPLRADQDTAYALRYRRETQYVCLTWRFFCKHEDESGEVASMRYAFHASWIGHLYRDQVISGGDGAEAHWLVVI